MISGKINQKVGQEHIKTKAVQAFKRTDNESHTKQIILMWITEVTILPHPPLSQLFQIFMGSFRMNQSHCTKWRHHVLLETTQDTPPVSNESVVSSW